MLFPLRRLLLDPIPVEGGGASTPVSTVVPSTQTPGVGEAGFSPRDFDTQGQGAGSSTAATGGMGLGGVQAPVPGGAGQVVPQPADPNNRVGQTQAQGQAQARDWQSIRDAATRYGYDLSSYDNDDAAFLHLIQAAQRAKNADVYAQVGRQIAPHLQQFQDWQRQQTQAQQTQQAPAYMPPEFDEKWMALVERDEASGVFYAKPGVNPAVADAVNKRMQWQERFTRDPIAVFEQYAKDKVAPLVNQAVQQQIAQLQQAQAVDQILASNADWLYQKDQSGRPFYGANGQRALTAEGTRYVQTIQHLQQSGVRDPRVQDTLARQLVLGEIAMARAQAGQTNVQQQTQVARQPNVNPLNARSPLERRQTPGSVEPSNEGLSLAEAMRRDFEAAGLTDADFNLG